MNKGSTIFSSPSRIFHERQRVASQEHQHGPVRILVKDGKSLKGEYLNGLDKTIIPSQQSTRKV